MASIAGEWTIEEEELTAQTYIKTLNDELTRRSNILTNAQWDYQSNITNENEKKANDLSSEFAVYIKVCVVVLLYFKLYQLYRYSIFYYYFILLTNVIYFFDL